MKTFQPYIDVTDALERVRGNKSVYLALLSVFLKDDHLSSLKTQMVSGDLDAAARTVHALKGLAANLSLMALYEAALLLESRFKNGEPTDALAQLEEIHDDTRRYVQRLMSVL